MPQDFARSESDHDPADSGFNEGWRSSHGLTGEQVDEAFRHGFDARDRFAERPFREVSEYLRESWVASGRTAHWDDVADIVRGGYERYKGAGLNYAADPGTEAIDRFQLRTSGGSVTGGGRLGDESHLGAAEPVSEESDTSAAERDAEARKGGTGESED